ncbi:relative of early flowering 6 [Actinidia rufa]|uniref:Relative of early flowering 6 n=1 Tax=Actinidia rufa TaxID=165716 RepID=A0A7J0GMK2_9ERIC|nr:relative of early flowering 6 [Actinidia rufa]
MASEQEVFPWLKALPLAPEYRPTRSEFEDPIAYIFKIEKEASKYGICKIVPPLAAPPKKTVVADMNRSLAARPGSSEPTFTTRQQQIGFCPRRHCPVQKPVWQSGESYTLSQFKAKAKGFEKNFLKKSPSKGLSALEIETHFWEASGDKPFSVEYANDIPGSAFAPVGVRSEKEAGEGVTVGETAWNMRGVSRAKGSLLRFMKAEIPGVMSPMVYVAMMFSWFAWHVEDHDLHSLNYLHMGAGKTWYGVPREAAVAFEEVVRVHGYGGEINPLVTFAVLGEKTTVMSPEVLIGAGVPCCRLVQNVGEFVVTFPRAYHSGFSHGFNCSEAANIATPEWLRVANDAAIRRASIKCPPMVSHFQLLYDLALSLCSRVSKSISNEPKSSRLKNKKKGEGKLSFGLSTPKEEIKTTDSLVSRQIMVDRMLAVKQLAGFYPVKGRFSSMFDGNRLSMLSGSDDAFTVASRTPKVNPGRERTAQGDRLSDQGLFSCVTCGILCFACVAIVQPREAAANYVMSADCSIFNDQDVGPAVNSDGCTVSTVAANSSELNSYSGGMGKSTPDGLFDVPIHSAKEIQIVQQSTEVDTDSETQKAASALGQLAINYGNSSDSDEEEVEADIPFYNSGTKSRDCSPVNKLQFDDRGLPSLKHHSEGSDCHRLGFGRDVPLQVVDSYEDDGHLISNFRGSRYRHQMKLSTADSSGSQVTPKAVTSRSNVIVPSGNATVPFASRSDEDSSRLHVFCLQHAAKVEQQLRPIGGARIMLLCHPDYPEIENESKLVAEELGIDYCWNNVAFREACEEDEERIQLAVESDVAIHGNGDWAVKLGIHLYYSANLSRSPLYSKQMPYNSIIYKAFGRSSPGEFCNKTEGRDTEEDVVEEGRTIHAQAKREVKHERLPESTLAVEIISAIRKTGKRRKSTREAGAMMKLKYQKIHDPEVVTATQDGSSRALRMSWTVVLAHALRKRNLNPSKELVLKKLIESKPVLKKQTSSKKAKKSPAVKTLVAQGNTNMRDNGGEYTCDMEGCAMSFGLKTRACTAQTERMSRQGVWKEVLLTQVFGSAPARSCGRPPLKCPWKGCKMTFKWAWARTEHIRVHTGERPYVCTEAGCGQTFRFVSDFSRHKRKTGHHAKKGRG